MRIGELDIREALGLSVNCTHKEKYDAIINFVGLDKIIPYIPFEKDVIAKAIKKDESLNNLSMKKWNAATGILITRNKDLSWNTKVVGGGVCDPLSSAGITAMSQAELVCVLKEAAALYVTMEE